MGFDGLKSIQIRTMQRFHLLYCSILLLLSIPIYLLDNYWLKSSGGNWISLDLTNMLIKSYLVFIGIHITISTLTIIYYPQFGVLKTHLYSAILSFVLLCLGFLLYDQFEKYKSQNKYVDLKELRIIYFNDIRLIRWWFFPNEKNPKEIHVDIALASAGRLAANVRGNEDGEKGQTIFDSDGEDQLIVKAGDTIHYVFPLTVHYSGYANDIEFTFHLFKHPLGQSGADDVSKIFNNTVTISDDGQFYYEKLVPPVTRAAYRDSL